MASIRKFLFDVEFAAPAAPPPVCEAEPPPPPTFSAEELDAARKLAFAEGREAALVEAARSAERQTGGALDRIAAALAAAAPAHAAALDAARTQALTLAAAVARKLAPALVQREAVAAVESVLNDILPQVIDEPRLVIRADGALVDGLKERIDGVAARSGYHGRIILLGDDRLQGADCRIEWADGGAEHDAAQLAADIGATVEKFLHGVGAAGDVPEEAPVSTASEETSHG